MSATLLRCFVLAAALVVSTLHTTSVSAEMLCGDATGDGKIVSGDALFTLRAAVGHGNVCPPPRCDTNQNGAITATDAMAILKDVVGLTVELHCPPEEPAVTTSTTVPSTLETTTTTLSAVCGNDILEDGEDCEPIQSFCRGGCNPFTGICVDFMCSDHCTCPKPMCGDAMIDRGEACDPPNSPCGDGSGTCSASCGCSQ